MLTKFISKLIDRFKMRMWKMDCLVVQAINVLERMNDLKIERHFENYEYCDLQMVAFYDREIETQEHCFSRIEQRLQKRYGKYFVCKMLKEWR